MLRPGRIADSGNTPANRAAITEIRSDPSVDFGPAPRRDMP
jgi:hypothetical protein